MVFGNVGCAMQMCVRVDFFFWAGRYQWFVDLTGKKSDAHYGGNLIPVQYVHDVMAEQFVISMTLS
jgi:hypothetical protein